MRNYDYELKDRIYFISNIMKSSHASGILYGNSGGKDSALVGIICKMACENTIGLIMPCGSQRNYNEDKTDAEMIAKQFGIETRVIDLSDVKSEFVSLFDEKNALTNTALANIAPRLRMTTLYAVGASESRLVAGTCNKSEGYMGYFTKWGEGAFDFNPIADFAVTEIDEFLNFLKAPDSIINKAPSAGLFGGRQMKEKWVSLIKALMTFYYTAQLPKPIK